MDDEQTPGELNKPSTPPPQQSAVLQHAQLMLSPTRSEFENMECVKEVCNFQIFAPIFKYFQLISNIFTYFQLSKYFHINRQFNRDS